MKQLELILVTPAAFVGAVDITATIYKDSPEISVPRELSTDHVNMLRVPLWCRDTDVDLKASQTAYTMGIYDAEEVFNNGKVAVWMKRGAAVNNTQYQNNYYKPNEAAVAQLLGMGIVLPIEVVGVVMIVSLT